MRRPGVASLTLTWTTNGDMDLHVRPPCGTEIYYGSRSACGGTLDRDDTSAPTGPENIYWNASVTTAAAACARRRTRAQWPARPGPSW